MGVRIALLIPALLALTSCVTGDRQVDALVKTGAMAAWNAVMW